MAVVKKASTLTETYGKQISQKDWKKQHWLQQGLVLERFCTVQLRYAMSLKYRKLQSTLSESQEEMLHCSSRGTRSGFFSRKEETSNASKEEFCFSSF